jgi:hypothetical protein
LPLLFNQETVEVVGQNGRGEGPGTSEASPVSVAAAKGVGTRESNDLLIIEAHTAEDLSEVGSTLSGVGKTAIRSTGDRITVRATRPVRNNRALHFLNGTDASENPEIRVADPGELGCVV